MTWMFAALAIANVVLAAIIVIVISHRPSATTVTVRPAGGAPIDPDTRQLLARLEYEQRELERKLADVQQLRLLVEQLSEQVRRCEQADKHERPGPRPHREPEEPADLERCDEVSCVLAILACGRLSAVKGNVKVRVRVSPAGSVDSVLVETTPEPALGACVAAAIQKATFEPTHRVGSFSYPFVFGASP